MALYSILTYPRGARFVTRFDTFQGFLDLILSTEVGYMVQAIVDFHDLDVADIETLLTGGPAAYQGPQEGPWFLLAVGPTPGDAALAYVGIIGERNGVPRNPFDPGQWIPAFSHIMPPGPEEITHGN